jgi:O-acetyl-ADP-ribose deacetylase (regulator of RNase III)
MTPGFLLPARHVIHAVGPVWRGGQQGEDRQLASCYRSSLALAAQAGLATVAFPAISTGIYGFPLERAIPLALAEIAAALEQPGTSLKCVTCCCFDAATLAAYEKARAELGL